jgi:hypothetical protein
VLWLLRQFPTLKVGIVSYDGDNAGQFSYLVRADIEHFRRREHYITDGQQADDGSPCAQPEAVLLATLAYHLTREDVMPRR